MELQNSSSFSPMQLRRKQLQAYELSILSSIR